MVRPALPTVRVLQHQILVAAGRNNVKFCSLSNRRKHGQNAKTRTSDGTSFGLTKASASTTKSGGSNIDTDREELLALNMSSKYSTDAAGENQHENPQPAPAQTTIIEEQKSKGASPLEPTTFEHVWSLRQTHFASNLSVSYSNTGPLMIMRGEGCRLYDHENVAYLDTRNNVAHVGHCNKNVVQAISEQVATLNTNSRYLHPFSSMLAQRLIHLFPSESSLGRDDGVVYFVNSGSEANDLALRLARAYTNSCHTIVLDHAYHGHTLASLAISPYKFKKSNECSIRHEQGWTFENTTASKNNVIHKVPCPDMYRIPAECEGLSLKEKTEYYVSRVQNVVDQISSSNDEQRQRPTFIMESGMSVAGVILPPPSYLSKVAAIVRDAGGIFIADEVQTGFGRFGQSDSNDERMWAFQYQNDNFSHGNSNDDNKHNNSNMFVPDIVTVGKPFGNGMPLAAVITSRTIADSVKVEYFNTFGGNPVCAAAGLAMLDELSSKQLPQNAYRVGTYLKQQLLKLKSEQEQQQQGETFSDATSIITIIGDVRGSGLFLGIEFVHSGTATNQTPATREASWICSKFKTHYHILTSLDGPYDNVMVIKPPMVFNQCDADEFLDALRLILFVDLPNAKRNGEFLQETQQHTPT